MGEGGGGEGRWRGREVRGERGRGVRVVVGWGGRWRGREVSGE